MISISQFFSAMLFWAQNLLTRVQIFFTSIANWVQAFYDLSVQRRNNAFHRTLWPQSVAEVTQFGYPNTRANRAKWFTAWNELSSWRLNHLSNRRRWFQASAELVEQNLDDNAETRWSWFLASQELASWGRDDTPSNRALWLMFSREETQAPQRARYFRARDELISFRDKMNDLTIQDDIATIQQWCVNDNQLNEEIGVSYFSARYVRLKAYTRPQNINDALKSKSQYTLMRSLYEAIRFKVDEKISQQMQDSYACIVRQIIRSDNIADKEEEVCGRLKTLKEFLEVVYQNSENLFDGVIQEDTPNRVFALPRLEEILDKKRWPKFLLNTEAQQYWDEPALIYALTQSAFAPALPYCQQNEEIIKSLCLAQKYRVIGRFTQWDKLLLVIKHYLNELEAKQALVTVSKEAFNYFVKQLNCLKKEPEDADEKIKYFKNIAVQASRELSVKASGLSVQEAVMFSKACGNTWPPKFRNIGRR